MISLSNSLEVVRLANLQAKPANQETSEGVRRLAETANGRGAGAHQLFNKPSLPVKPEERRAEANEEQKPVDRPSDQFRYRFDDRVNGLVVEVVDWKSGDVVRTIPPESFIKLHAKADSQQEQAAAGS